MTVLTYISNFDENKNLYIVNGGRIVTYYDGKNSIDEIYNTFNIRTICTDTDGNATLYI